MFATIDQIEQANFKELKDAGLIKEKRLRNVIIYSEFRELRKKKIRKGDCIEKLQEKYPELAEITLERICGSRENHILVNNDTKQTL